jgi:hypothetical protein
MGIFAGICLGVGLIFAREFLDSSFLDLEEAKIDLGVPILGAISRLTTQEEIDKEKAKQKKLITIGAIVSATLLIITLLFYLLRR